jgi:Glycosyl-hydrolase 97 N-terminal
MAPALFPALAQDERQVASPDGRVVFRVYMAPQAPGDLFRLAYDVTLQGKPVIARSYLGLDLLYIEPLLGEKDGLIGSKMGSGAGYNSLLAEYMQDGSLGDRIDIEARVYNDGVAFRYVLPRTTPLADLKIVDEATEFRFFAGSEALRGVPETGNRPLPFVTALAGGGLVAILEVRPPDFPAMSLARLDTSALVTRLARMPNDSELAFVGHTPFTGPWRVILFGKDRARMLDSAWLKNLKP